MAEKRELWIINGYIPVEWEIPVWAVEDDNVARVSPATYLLSSQRSALAGAMRIAGVEDSPTSWRVPMVWLKKNGKQAKNTDPESNLLWGRKLNKSQMNRKEQPLSRDRADFLDAMFDCGLFKDRQELELFWSQFCNHAGDWLLNKRRPVDMYFLKLHPSPYRANWKSILMSRFRRLGKHFFSSSSKETRERILVESGFVDELLCLDLLAMSRDSQTCVSRVEVEHGLQWFKMVHKVETAHLAQQGQVNYASGFMAYVKSQIPSTIRLYTEHLAQIARFTAAPVEGDRGGTFFLAPNSWHTRNRPNPPKVDDLPIVVGIGLPRQSGASAPEALFSSDAVVSEVSPVQPGEENLRDENGDQ